MRTRSQAPTLFHMPDNVSGASGALATLILLVFIFMLVLLTGTQVKDPLISAIGPFGNFRAWGAENRIADNETAAPGIVITTPAEAEAYYYDERVGIAGRAVPDEGRKTSMVFYRVNEGEWVKAALANDTWTGVAEKYPEGRYRVEAIAYDDNGGESAPVEVNFTSHIRYVPDARFIGDDIPAEMTAGAVYVCHIVYENSGNLEWNNSGGYLLAPYAGTDFGAGDCAMPGPGVLPGGSVTFTVTLTAPATPGDYVVSYRMQGGGYGWFGDEARKHVRVEAAVTPTPGPTPEPTSPPYVAYDAYGKFIMIGRNGMQETGYLFLWCYDGPFGPHNQRSSYLNEPWWPHPDWDIGGPNGHYRVYSDYYDGSGTFEMNNGGTRGPFTFYIR